MEFSPLMYAIITGVFAAGSAAGAVKVALNGTKIKVDEVHSQLRDHVTEENNNDRETHERIAKVETKLDMLISRSI